MKNHKSYAGWYFVILVESVFSLCLAEYTNMDLLLRFSLIVFGWGCIHFSRPDLLKFGSVGLLILTISGINTKFERKNLEKTSVVKSDLKSQIETIPKLDLSSCKEFGNNWNCIAELKKNHREEIARIKKENYDINHRIENVKVELTFIETLPILLSSLFACLFVYASIAAAREKVQEVKPEKVKPVIDKKETVNNIMNHSKKRKISIELACIENGLSHSTFKRWKKTFEPTPEKNEPLRVLRGKVS